MPSKDVKADKGSKNGFYRKSRTGRLLVPTADAEACLVAWKNVKRVRAAGKD